MAESGSWWRGAAVTQKLIVYADVDGGVRSYRVEDGSSVWARPYRAQGPIVACPVIDGDVVAVPSLMPTALEAQPSLVRNCLELQAGRRLWGQYGGTPWQPENRRMFSRAMPPLVHRGRGLRALERVAVRRRHGDRCAQAW